MDALKSNQSKVAVVSFGEMCDFPSVFASLYQGLARAIDRGLLHRVYWAHCDAVRLDHVDQHPNIEMTGRLPEYALLQHPATRLFVSHGGAESSHQAMLSGIPLLVIPLFADQPGNAARIGELNIGRTLHKEEVTEELVFGYIQQIMSSTALQRNAKRIKEIAQRSSQRGLRDAVETLETIALVGDAHMFPEDRDEHWTKAYNYDVVLFVCFVCVAFVTVSGSFMFSLYPDTQVTWIDPLLPKRD
jgi:hypothetical protein